MIKNYNNIILAGPFVGSFKEEIENFRPFIQWIKENVPHSDFFVLTHYNRAFMYKEKVVPIFRQYTRDEENQRGHLHNKINPFEWNIIKNTLKDDIIDICEDKKTPYIFYNLGYNKTSPIISVYQKIYNPIENLIKFDSVNETDILFIPSIEDTEEISKEIHERLKHFYDVKIIGDNNINLIRENIIKDYSDYFDNVYKYILASMKQAKCVITPCSHWTLLANLQRIPVFSWGSPVSIYKNTGIFGFENKNVVIPFDDDSNVKNLIKSIINFVEGVENNG